QPRHSHRRCPLRTHVAPTLDPSRYTNPGRVQPARLLSAPLPHRAVGEPLGSVPGPAGRVWGVLQESPPLHSGHHALPDAPPHPVPPLLGFPPDERAVRDPGDPHLGFPPLSDPSPAQDAGRGRV